MARSAQEMTTAQLSAAYVYATATLSPYNGGLRYFSIEQKTTSEAHARAVLAEHNKRLWQATAWEQSLVECLPSSPPFAVDAWTWAEETGFACKLQEVL